MGEVAFDFDEFMDRVQNDKELLFELLDIFINDFSEKRQLLGEAIETSNSRTVEHVAHFLKGSCGNISAKALRAVFLILEEKGRCHDMEGIEKYLGDIDQKFEDLMIEIGELRLRLQ